MNDGKNSLLVDHLLDGEESALSASSIQESCSDSKACELIQEMLNEEEEDEYPEDRKDLWEFLDGGKKIDYFGEKLCKEDFDNLIKGIIKPIIVVTDIDMRTRVKLFGRIDKFITEQLQIIRYGY